ncbi:helix-turn-helix domain-containing protein [Cupriavidus sp. a3]|uniref:helix-turn-helix domain-containing protein n=1 Tax=Cupriavidus sp. a3 TaxID=3242158 RepID=UPI003D9C4D5D
MGRWGRGYKHLPAPRRNAGVLSTLDDNPRWGYTLLNVTPMISGSMATNKKLTPPPQQELLREAMVQLGMTREEFATRISVSRRTLDKWLLPNESSDFRALPDMGRAYIQEILAWNAKRA